ncbi:MAG: leucine-rich repeat domain-containing protein, partial [Oscillospiraceae bacterium]|nr:leucine-rich repeat domain-containing protein [Oscillospiraceae bacterium]
MAAVFMLILTAVLAVCLPTRARAAATVDASPDWYFDGPTGTLTIYTNAAANSTQSVYWRNHAQFDTGPEREAVERIVISEGVTEIGESAFDWCHTITDVTFPATLKTIGRGAFRQSQFTDITFPAGSSLEVIGSEAFTWCNALTSLDLSACLKLQTFGERAFSRCDLLRDVTFPATNTLTSIGNYAFSSTPARGDIDLSVCTGLLNTGSYAFYESGVTSVKLPDSLETLGVYGFYRCPRLLAADISNTKIKQFGYGAFSVCAALESVNLPATVELIGNSAFSNLPRLRTVNFEDLTSLRTIESSAFLYCVSLQSAIFAEGLETIESGAFQYTGIKTLVLPSTVTSLAAYAFSGSANLKTADLSKAVNLKELMQGCFNESYSLETVLLPEGLEKIEYNAFSSCTSLLSVEFPSTLKEIGVNAFQYCTSLTSVDFSKCDNLTFIDNDVFYDDPLIVLTFGENMPYDGGKDYIFRDSHPNEPNQTAPRQTVFYPYGVTFNDNALEEYIDPGSGYWNNWARDSLPQAKPSMPTYEAKVGEYDAVISVDEIARDWDI